MRGRVSKRASMLVALAALTVWIGGSIGARADHGADNPLYIQQAGNGAGASTPVISGFAMHTVLFSATRFPLTNGAPRPGGTKYIAYGTIPDGDLTDPLLAKVAYTKSDDGLRWSDPVEITVKDDATGTDLPIIVSERQFQMDVEFDQTGFTSSANQKLQFAIYYHYLPGTGDATLYSISGIHRALSLNGDSFLDDKALSQTGVNVLDGSACAATSFKCGSYGATDVIYQPSQGTAATCGTVDPDGAGPKPIGPWNCAFVMVYNSFDRTASGQEFASIASSPDGLAWSGTAAPILCPGNSATITGCAAQAATGQWDDDNATLAHIRRIPTASTPPYNTTFVAYYSGGLAPDNTCSNGGTGCWSLGTAVSTNGVTFTKNPANPMTPHSLLETVNASANPVVSASNAKPANLSTLWNAVPLDIGKVSHQPIYFTRISNTAGAPKEVFLAYTAPVPTSAPQVRITDPNDFEKTSTVPLEIYFGDTLGSVPAKIGVDISTLALTIDGNPLGGAVPEESIVSTYLYSGYKVTVRRDLLGQLADGVHTVGVSITDLDGNTTTKTMSFIVDTLAPVTTKDPGWVAPAPAKIMMPTSSLGTFVGQTKDGNGSTTGTPLTRLKAVVTNPLGLQKIYDLTPKPDGTGPIELIVNARTWNYRWVAPTFELTSQIPGPYTVSILGVDSSLNVETPSPTNTYSFVIV